MASLLQRKEDVLKHLLSMQKSKGGLVSWREFMQLALYDPEYGYYSRTITDVGTRGDFTTAPVVSSLLGEAIFLWAERMRSTYPSLRHAPLLEIGGGSGALAHSIMKARGWCRFLEPYGIVEISTPLRKKQQKLLRGRRIQWFTNMQEALHWAKGSALIFSNELVDAFPCSLWQKESDAEWREVCISIEEQKIYEGLRSSPLPSSSIFMQSVPTGQRVETHESWREWLSEWTGVVRNVAMLTIDYGGREASQYHRKRLGTLRAFWRQQCFTGSAIYSRFGQQDLTADVNFTDLETWGGEFGWETLKMQTLAEWLSALGKEKVKNDIDIRFLNEQNVGGEFLAWECVLFS